MFHESQQIFIFCGNKGLRSSLAIASHSLTVPIIIMKKRFSEFLLLQTKVSERVSCDESKNIVYIANKQGSYTLEMNFCQGFCCCKKWKSWYTYVPCNADLHNAVSLCALIWIISSDSTKAIFEINPPLALKNQLLTDNLIGQPYWGALLDRLIW